MDFQLEPSSVNTPEVVLENDINILCDFSAKTDHKLEYNKCDIITADKETKECNMIDVVCPFDT